MNISKEKERIQQELTQQQQALNQLEQMRLQTINEIVKRQGMLELLAKLERSEDEG